MKTGLFLLLLCAGAPAALFLFHQRPEASAGGEGGGDPVRAILGETDWNDYQWPTDASTKRTSCFCEFRANHFHAGIDVSTGMQTGFKVFASRGGWLHSVSFEPFGYGWILTVKQPDGYSTSYAHLKGFPAKIRAAYLAKLAASGHSFGLAEFAPDEVPVKKGEVVAYTGDTGAGPPHLHFEVRDRDDNPVNPGLAKHLRPIDSIAPEPRQICFMPMDALSTVNGRTEPLIVSIGGSGPKSYRIAGVPVLRGRVGVLLRAHDRANDAVDYPTPYLLDMRVDGKPYFESRFDRIQERFGWHIRIDRDHAMMKAQQGEFRKLYREEGNALSVYRAHTADDGVLPTAPGKHAVTIHAADVSGNSATISFDVNCGPYTAPEAGLQAPPKRRKNARGALEAVPAALSATREFRFDEIVYTIRARALSKPPSVQVTQGETTRSATVVEEGPGRYRAVLRAWEGFAGTARTVITSGPDDRSEQWTDSFDAFLISSAQGGTLRSGNGEFSMRFAPGDVYRSMLCRVTSQEKDGRTVWHAWPDDVPLAGKPVVSIAASTGNARASFIKAFHPFVFLRYNRSSSPSAQGTVEGAFGRLLGEYVLREDRSGPVIDGGSGRGGFRFRIVDSLSGVAPLSIVVKAGDAIVPVEFSEGQKSYVVPPDVWKTLRAPVLSVRAEDMLGNATTREFRIR